MRDFLVGVWNVLAARKPMPAPLPPVGSPPVAPIAGPPSGAKIVLGGATAVLIAAATMVAPFEGYYGKTYRDVVGVETVCFGETDRAAVRRGKTYRFSKEECTKMLADRLPEYDNGVLKCIHREMPFSVHVSVISLAYNIGIHGVCKSTIAAKINAGDFKGACNAFLSFDHAGGRRVLGLTRRRQVERKRCLEGL